MPKAFGHPPPQLSIGPLSRKYQVAVFLSFTDVVVTHGIVVNQWQNFPNGTFLRRHSYGAYC